MKEANDFFRRFKEKMVGGLNTCAIGLIENYDPVKLKADVRILPGETLIKSVPVVMQQTSEFYIRLPYKRDDPVLVVFAQREIDNIMYQANNPASQRMLAVDDALVVGGINFFTNDLPSENAEKLLIGEKFGGATIAIGGGKIIMKGIVEVNGSKIG
ncbi:TPA: Gp138 family membrane-puncturing spike protein [Bacillus cereus]